MNAPKTVENRLSVIIPSLDGERGGNVSALLGDLKSQTLPPDEIELVIAVRPNGRARNIGLSRTTGRNLVFIDDDVRLGDERVLETLVDILENHPDVGAVGISQQLPADANDFQKRAAGQLARTISLIVDEMVDTDMATHMCLAIRRTVYEEVGGEDDNLPRGTDPDLRARLLAAGYRVVLAPNAWGTHPPPANLAELRRIYYRNGYGSALVQKHYPDKVFSTAVGHDPATLAHPGLFARLSRFIETTMAHLLAGHTLALVAQISYLWGYVCFRFFEKYYWKLRIKRVGKILLAPLGILLSVISIRLQGKAGLRILTYHRVDRFRDRPLMIHPDRFERQMAYIKQRFELVSLDEGVHRLKEGILTGSEAVVTFDDGYLDALTNAHPILRKYDIPATLFVASDFVGSEGEFPWVARLGPPDYKILSAEQLKQMVQEGWSIGAHTCSHPRLPKCSAEQKRREITESKRVLEERLGIEVRHFAYPFGAYADVDNESAGMARAAGYASACTAQHGFNYPGGDVMQLRRTNIDPSDGNILFKMKCDGLFDWWRR
jgi:peptidoglycan/xylan/chitin deacetylase (PgdA/CDA1 family)